MLKICTNISVCVHTRSNKSITVSRNMKKKTWNYTLTHAYTLHTHIIIEYERRTGKSTECTHWNYIWAIVFFKRKQNLKAESTRLQNCYPSTCTFYCGNMLEVGWKLATYLKCSFYHLNRQSRVCVCVIHQSANQASDMSPFHLYQNRLPPILKHIHIYVYALYNKWHRIMSWYYPFLLV